MNFLDKTQHLKWVETEMLGNKPRFYGFEIDSTPKIELIQFINDFPLISYSLNNSEKISMYGLIILTFDVINETFVKSNIKTNELIKIYRELEAKNKQANTPLQIVPIKVNKELKLLDQLHINVSFD